MQKMQLKKIPMNNANFGFDCCRNNANNAKFELIMNEISEVSYIKRYNLFDSKVSNFVNSDMLEQQIEQDFQQQIVNIKHDNPLRSAKISSIKNQNKEDLDALDYFKTREKIKK